MVPGHGSMLTCVLFLYLVVAHAEPESVFAIAQYRAAAGGTLDGVPNWHSSGPVSARVCMTVVAPAAATSLLGLAVKAACILCAMSAVYFLFLSRVLFYLGAPTMGVNCRLAGVEFDLVCTPVWRLVYIALRLPWFTIVLRSCSRRTLMTMALLLYMQPVSAMNEAYIRTMFVSSVGVLPYDPCDMCVLKIIYQRLGRMASPGAAALHADLPCFMGSRDCGASWSS